MSVSLQGSLRTCKVDVGWANKLESDRFENPAVMVCPTWNGVDAAGRVVCPDSFYTKRAGCNSANDRVIVENNVSRPQYIEYVNLDASGIRGNFYGNPLQSETATDAKLNSLYNVTGSAGYQLRADRRVSCSGGGALNGQLSPSWNNYGIMNGNQMHQQQMAQARRVNQMNQDGFSSQVYRQNSGFGCI